jgi:hypothetical protein
VEEIKDFLADLQIAGPMSLHIAKSNHTHTGLKKLYCLPYSCVSENLPFTNKNVYMELLIASEDVQMASAPYSWFICNSCKEDGKRK